MNIKLPAVYDVSHWEIIPDFAKVSPKPLLFITKATEGTTFVDGKFIDYLAGMKRIDVRRGVYHFHRKFYTGIAQAQHFTDTIQDYITGSDILILDVEEGGESVGQLQAFFDYVHLTFPNNQLMIYSRKNILDALSMTTAQKEYFREIPVWSAGYPNDPDAFNTVPASYVPDQTKWGEVWLWQYSAAGIVEGIDGGVDVNWIAPEFATLLEHPGEVPQEVPTEEPMGTNTFSNGVRIIEGTHANWGYRAIVVPAAAISSATLRKGSFAPVESITGDIVFNWTPFDNQGNLVLGLRIGGISQRSYVDFNPFIFWSANKLLVAHTKITFNATNTAGQGYRYLIERGVKNANANSDWDFRAARRVVATNAQGDTIILTTKGVSGQNVGLKLHETCDLLFSLGLGVTYAVDGDGGGSAQDYVKVDGTKQVFRGDVNEVRNVPVYGVINLSVPLTGGVVPPPPPPPAPTDPDYLLAHFADGSTKKYVPE